MLISRGLSVLTRLNNLNNVTVLNQPIRNGHHWNYRKARPTPPRNMVLMAELIQGFAWWWVLWHLWTEPGHVFGEFEYPDASKWTDDELGIPSS
ncbi:NADH dehydrogenase [ubiquinone] 1 beta subcomplex subunit 2, mitochondrial-like [Anoplophora glabripennis]|uniref:NADH dehydrogenase [ubiquinone] 1 beta subcomplex subunit 2, mitochondrial-like n=1 Tax=Anoplophora glabripennis TaxID=217634 RepID=UPI000874B961|nr:NADH dehydrogenase [ubiquinone] 1 beta subcomplex subunit 2, mitochondrial-like [Anoplophora glabripennis]